MVEGAEDRDRSTLGAIRARLGAWSTGSCDSIIVTRAHGVIPFARVFPLFRTLSSLLPPSTTYEGGNPSAT